MTIAVGVNRPLVVVGASLAGLRAVQAARRAGHPGPITLVGAEPHLPYDRPPLSKAFLAAGPLPEPPSYSSAEELRALDVDLHLGRPATGLDVEAREVVLGDERLPYGALVIATGAVARHLPGEQFAGVHTLRTLDDARALRAGLDAGARVVVVGAGFIGAEVASAARARGLPVTVVEAAPVPLVRAVGELAGGLCAALHDRHGTDLRVGVGVARLAGSDRVEAVVLDDGTRLPADLVVVGIGATPATGWLAGSGLTLDDGVRVDPTLHAGAPGVWAAGDVARVVSPGGSVRLEHWTSAAEQGALAARNALDPAAASPYTAVPYFWSDSYGHKLQMVGHAPGGDVEVLGDADSGPWTVLYRSGDALAGALTLDLPGRIMKYRAMIARSTSWDDALAAAASRPGVAAQGSSSAARR